LAGTLGCSLTERGEITLETAAKIVGVCNMTAPRMLRRGDIKRRKVCPGAPRVIKTGMKMRNLGDRETTRTRTSRRIPT
jgi:hypothetical protein